jgi:hypothetical protein
MSYFYNNNSIYINMIFQLQFVYLDTRLDYGISIIVQANRNRERQVSVLVLILNIIFTSVANAILNMLVQNVWEHKINLPYADPKSGQNIFSSN